MSEARTNRRPRVSLLSLLLLTALTVTSLTTVVLWQEVSPLRSEVRRLRLEAGVLRVEDRKLVHAIGAETYVTKAWKWRVWVPAGRRVAVHVAAQGIPMTGSAEFALPRVAGRLEINRRNSAGTEVELTLAAEKTLDGKVRWILREGNVSTYIPVPADADEWMQASYSGSSGGGLVEMSIKEQPGQPLVLLHKRVFYQRGQIPPANTAETGDGVMAWIEGVKD